MRFHIEMRILLGTEKRSSSSNHAKNALILIVGRCLSHRGDFKGY